eukprot:jgi/Pico_ML_1/52494/g3192.t1
MLRMSSSDTSTPPSSLLVSSSSSMSFLSSFAIPSMVLVLPFFRLVDATRVPTKVSECVIDEANHPDPQDLQKTVQGP